MSSTRAVKERPILMSGAMVRALLDGSKTQTRRVMKHQITTFQTWGSGIPRTVPGKWCVHARFALPHQKPLVTDPPGSDDAWYPCPYGKPGDRLWVRETWKPTRVSPAIDGENRTVTYTYAAGGEQIVKVGVDCGWVAVGQMLNEKMKVGAWRPSIFMPRRASRLTLEIVSVSVERLQDISEEDAKAEGIVPLSGFGPNGDSEVWGIEGMVAAVTAKMAYQYLWESINGPGSWDANPWVWVVEFKRVGGEA